MTVNISEAEKKVRAESLAEKIKILFVYCYQFSADLDLLKEVVEVTSDKAESAISMAPILGAAGIDFEEAEIQNRYRAKRGRALINLIETLIDTEKEVKEFNMKKIAQVETNKKLRKMLGI